MAVEHPAQVIVAHLPGDRRKRLAALKKWIGADGHAYANVYLPTEVVKYRSKNPQTQADYELANSRRRLRRLGTTYRRSRRQARLRRRPGRPALQQPRDALRRHERSARGDPAHERDQQASAGHDDRLGVRRLPAARPHGRRAAEGPRPRISRLATAELKAAISRLWNFESKDAKVTSLETVRPEQLRQADRDAHSAPRGSDAHPAALPPESIVNASGDALKAAEAGLVSKVEKKILDFSDAWEEAIRLSFKATGDKRKAEATDLETIWADPEKKSEAEKVDAAQKLLALDVPHEIAWERAGLSPKEIEKAKKALPETLARKAASIDGAPAGGSPADPRTGDVP
jgi:hypothetical protein